MLILEGMHCLGAPALRALAGRTVFVDADTATRRLRRIARDVAERGRTAADTARQFDTVVEPMHRLHVVPTRALAGRCVANQGDVAALHRAAQVLAAEIARQV